jgi:hypothetical protein
MNGLSRVSLIAPAREALRSPLLRLPALRRRLGSAIRRARAAALYARYCDHTMVPKGKFIDNLVLLSHVSNVRGAVVECGVWRGGMSAGMADVLGADRHYYLFDSFEGLPAAKEIDGPAALRWQANPQGRAYHDNCRAEIGFAKSAMDRSSATRVTLMKGWFSETLPGFVVPGGIAVLRLDADWYDSTLQCLESLYQQVVPGGLIVIDDYYTWDGCAKAVHDYLSRHQVSDRIRQSRRGVCYLIHA